MRTCIKSFIERIPALYVVLFFSVLFLLICIHVLQIMCALLDTLHTIDNDSSLFF